MNLSRRMFLRGTGSTVLAIPFLPSLLPRSAKGQSGTSSGAAAPCYVQWVTNHGVLPERFWPTHAPSTEVLPGILARALTDETGALSDVLDGSWSSLRSQVNVIRGLDLLASAHYNNASVPTCASWPRQDSGVPGFAHSVDSILGSSALLYPTPPPMPVLRLTPGVNSSAKWGSFCWTTRSNTPFKLPGYAHSTAALQAIFSSPSQNATRLVDDVLRDYNDTVNSPHIGTNDRQQLEDYIALLGELQSRMAANRDSCTAPSVAAEPEDFEALHDNAIDIAVAAMACRATRVVAYHCYHGGPSLYDEGLFRHWAHTAPEQHVTMQRFRYRQLAKLVGRMDSLVESDGNTLLNNSLVYANNELPDPRAQRWRDFPVITAGTAGGRLRTGQYLDFGGHLLNSLLVTIFHTMGLPPQHFEQDSPGFGEYEGTGSDDYQPHLTTTARRQALGYLYLGS